MPPGAPNMPTAPTASDYTIYQRAGSANWYVRFSIKGHGQLRRSLETNNQAFAEKLAYALWRDTKAKADKGLDIKPRLFKDVAEQYIEHLAKQYNSGDKNKHVITLEPATIRRYFLPQLGEMPIGGIGVGDITAYMEWRKAYWVTGPGAKIDTIIYRRGGRIVKRPVPSIRQPATPSRLKRESVMLRQIFKQAIRWGYITESQVPFIENVKAADNPRPSFSAKEFKKLHVLALKRIYEEGISKHIKNERITVFAYINLAAYSGMRPTELKNLRWGDINNYTPPFDELSPEPRTNNEISFAARGKGLNRTFIPHPHATISIDFLYKLWMELFGKEPGKDDPVFFTQTGEPLGSIIKSLQTLLRLTDLETNQNGARRTTYSFRHFYISQMLVNDVSIYTVAKNAGTSPDMVNRFYADVDIKKSSDELRKKWSKST